MSPMNSRATGPVERREAEHRPIERESDDERLGRQRTERADDRDAGGDRHHLRHHHPVDAVHEVDEIDEPQRANEQQGALEPEAEAKAARAARPAGRRASGRRPPPARRALPGAEIVDDRRRRRATPSGASASSTISTPLRAASSRSPAIAKHRPAITPSAAGTDGEAAPLRRRRPCARSGASAWRARSCGTCGVRARISSAQTMSASSQTTGARFPTIDQAAEESGIATALQASLPVIKHARALAGAPGFEPGYDGIKIRCLTTWRRPILPDGAAGLHG